MIESNSNNKIKLIRSLYNKKNRYAKKMYLAEGLQLVLDYIEFSNSIECILVSEDFKDIDKIDRKKELEIYTVKNSVFDKISNTKNSQGIIAVVNFENYKLEEILKSKILILIDGIQDPGNLGAIIRTCDAFNIGGIITLENTVDIYNNKSVRASMGSISRIPVISFDNNDNLIKNIKNNNFKIMATTPNFKKEIKDIDKNNKIALVIGNESNGVSNEILSNSDDLVGIKMKSELESLNASIAAGITIYEISKDS